jgi:hypothetical protein
MTESNYPSSDSNVNGNSVKVMRLPVSGRIRHLGTLGIVLITSLSSFAFVLIVLRPPIPGTSGNWYALFRGYFASDQLSYAAIASNVAKGGTYGVEPFTESGVSYYPSLYYAIMGVVARVFGWSIPTAWTALGYAVVGVGVFATGLFGVKLSGRPWAPILVGPLLLTGTLSIIASDDWYTRLSSHGVIWGAFGSLFTLNAEVAAIIAVALALLWAQSLLGSPRGTPFAWVGPGALLGLVANVHTYPFFLGVAVVVSWCVVTEVFGGSTWSRRMVLACSLVVALHYGPNVAESAGQLVVFGTLVLAAAPGWLPLVLRYPRCAFWVLLGFVVAASPQVIGTVVGLSRRDEFLLYRQASSSNLGVPVGRAIIAVLPLILVVLFCMHRLRGAENVGDRRMVLGIAMAASLMTFNDKWGFGQEPYRFLIGSIALSVLLLSPLLAKALASPMSMSGGLHHGVSVWLGSIALIAIGLAWLDFGAFRLAVAGTGTIDVTGGKYAAIGSRLPGQSGLVAVGPCLDPRLVKLASGRPVAHYNRGIAWPQDKDAVDDVMRAATDGRLGLGTLADADIEAVVLDGSCDLKWEMNGQRNYEKVGMSDQEVELHLEYWIRKR